MVILKFKKSNTFGKYIGVYLHLKENNNHSMENIEGNKEIYKEIINFKYEEHTNLVPKYIKELLSTFPVASRYFFIKPDPELEKHSKSIYGSIRNVMRNPNEERVLIEWYK
jgi:hypothetical protein